MAHVGSINIDVNVLRNAIELEDARRRLRMAEDRLADAHLETQRLEAELAASAQEIRRLESALASAEGDLVLAQREIGRMYLKDCK